MKTNRKSSKIPIVAIALALTLLSYLNNTRYGHELLGPIGLALSLVQLPALFVAGLVSGDVHSMSEVLAYILIFFLYFGILALLRRAFHFLNKMLKNYSSSSS